jgi:hypothetical protein
LWISSIALEFFLSFFFFNFIIQYWVEWELDFIIYFGLRFMKLSRSHESGHGFGRLTHVFFHVLFLIDFF